MILKQAIKVLNSGGLVVFPTDTLYGILAKSDMPAAVSSVYKVKKRNPDKPLIVLVSSVDQLEKFGVVLQERERELLGSFWPGKVSVIFKGVSGDLFYLHRGGGSLAFRLPESEDLLGIIKKTGPLVAPSANPEGLPPAQSVAEAQTYFGEGIDLYVDGGNLSGKPSTLIELKDGEVSVLRQGDDLRFKI